MKSSVILLGILLTLLNVETICGQPWKRITHATINGEVRGNGSLPTMEENSYLLVELRFSRDDRPRSVARKKIQLNNTSATHSFALQFKLRYPLSKISPHNTYILSAKIFDGNHRLLYVGDLGLPVTERREKQAKYLIIQVIPTRRYNFWVFFNNTCIAFSFLV